MKNLYKQLNDIDIDVSKFEEIEVTEFEKAQYKKDLKNKVSKSKSKIWVKYAAAVCLSLGIGTASIVGLSYTTFAQDIPIINSIIKIFSDKEKTLADAEEFVEPLNMVVESNGTTITINESLFDSNKFTVGYTIETAKDLGDDIQLKGEFTLKGHDYSLHQGDFHRLEKVGENQYVGLSIATLPINTSLQEANFEFNIAKISSEDQKETIDGNWNFNLHAKATENTAHNVHGVSLKDDLSIQINQITYTPFSFTINYKEVIKNQELIEKWDLIASDLNVKDNLGNTYSSRVDGGSGDVPGEMNIMVTFEKLHPDAKTLIITPSFRLMEAYSVDENGVKMFDYNSDSPKELIELEDIIVEIEK